MILDIVARAFLFFSNQYALIAIITVGYCIINKNIFTHALMLIFVSMLINISLKHYFQIPALTGLEGYSFPSGHEEFATAFWLYLAFRSKHLGMHLLSTLLIVGIGASLIHFNYHTIGDVLGGVGFAIITLVIYELLRRACQQKFAILCIPALIGLILPVVAFWLVFAPTPVPPNAFAAISGIFGFVTGSLLEEKILNFNPKTIKLKPIFVSLALVSVSLIYFGIQTLALEPAIKYSLLLGSLTFWISFVYPYLYTRIVDAYCSNHRPTRTDK